MNLRTSSVALLTGGLILSTPALTLGQTWVERGDAPDFPDRIAQRTLEQGPLRTIAGGLGLDGGDSSDAFCVRLPHPASFVATTDPSLAPAAKAGFEVRLLLFDTRGRHLLTGQGSDPRRQSLAPALATAPAAAGLGPPGEYVLVVAGDGAATGTYVVELEGAEGCGTLDIVLAVDGLVFDRYCLGSDQAADFHCHGISGEKILTSGVALGHFNADVELDAVLATTSTAEPNRICPGDGPGRFSFGECSAIGLPGASSRDAAVGDLDDDGSLDVVFAEAGGAQSACLGDGALSFTCFPVDPNSWQHRGVALGHVDDNADLDAVFANFAQESRVCLGDGSGGFSCSNVFDGGWFATGVAVGLFDADTNLDLAFSAFFGARVCLGDGAGAFTCTQISGFNGTGVAVGRLDGDEHLDLVFSANSGQPEACLGDGAGGFACSLFGGGHFFGRTTGVALEDFDGDSVLDVAISADPDPGSFCFGDGAGSFTGCKPLNEHAYPAQGLAVGALAAAAAGVDDFETGDLRAWAFSVPEP